MKVYWHQGAMTADVLYDQLGVFAGSTNPAMQPGQLVKTPAANGPGALRLFWYVYANPFANKTDIVSADVLFPLTGLNAPGWGVDGAHGPIAMGTDGAGSISCMISPVTAYAGEDGSVVTVVAQYDFKAPLPNPWADGGALCLTLGVQTWGVNVSYHDGTVGGDGGVYFYPTFSLVGPAGESLMYCLRVFQDKYFPVEEMSDVSDAVVSYAGGALVSSKLGKSVLHDNIGAGAFSLVQQPYQRMVVKVDKWQIGAAIALVNSALGFDYPTDYRVWGVNQIALDIESIATGVNNPKIGLTWNVLELAAI